MEPSTSNVDCTPFSICLSDESRVFHRTIFEYLFWDDLIGKGNKMKPLESKYKINEKHNTGTWTLLSFDCGLWCRVVSLRWQQQRLRQPTIEGTTKQQCWNCQKSRRTFRPKKTLSKLCRMNHKNYSMGFCLIEVFSDLENCYCVAESVADINNHIIIE